MNIGELFVEGTEDDCTEFVEMKKKAAKTKFDELEGESENLNGEMKELKAILYAKFGNNINLETK